MSHADAFPTTPWHCNHHEICALDADDALSSVHDSDGSLIAIVQPGPSQVGDLIALAPDLLATLTNLVSTLCRIDVEYCKTHELEPFSGTQLAAALADAITLIRHAAELGVPIKVELPE